jgi:hopanoid biosynthesis associated protein HpnK
MPQLIVTADDFGRSAAINAAVLEAHARGILTSASLMVTGEAADEAAAIARRTPSLAVGLHVVVVQGRSALPHSELPHITDERGQLPDDPTAAGWHYFHSEKARRELAAEIRAQFERFADLGFPLSHVDGHLHMHVHPSVLEVLLPLAERFRARGFRVPRDDFALSWEHERIERSVRAARAAALGLLSRWSMRRLRRTPLRVVDRVYGVLQSGRMTESYVMRVLKRVATPTAELYLHPSTRFEGDRWGPNPGDLKALVSPAVRQAVHTAGHRLATYPTLETVAA